VPLKEQVLDSLSCIDWIGECFSSFIEAAGMTELRPPSVSVTRDEFAS